MRTPTPFPRSGGARGEHDVWLGAPGGPGAGLPAERVRALAVGAWYAADAGAPHDGLDLAVSPAGPDGASPRRAEALEVLTDGWGVTSEEEALRTVARLRAGMHDDLYVLVSPLVDHALAHDERRPGRQVRGPEEEQRELLRSLASVHGLASVDVFVRYFDAWLQARRLGLTAGLRGALPPDVRGWDLARAAHVTRLALTAGLVGEEMAWEELGRTLEHTREHYATWRQLGRAFLAGFAFWQSFTDLSALEAGLARRTPGVQGLHLRPTSPWTQLALHAG